MFPVPAPVPCHSQASKQNLKLTMGTSGKGFGNFLYLSSGSGPVQFPEGPIAKGTGMVLRYFFVVCVSRARFESLVGTI